MKVILLKNIEGLGDEFETITVKNGYGRNYLIPQKLAVIANKANQAQAAERVRQITAKERREREKVEALMEQIKASPIKIGAKVGTTDKIFGSVNNVQLADAIKRQTGVEVDRRKIVIKEEIKTLGSYTATVKFREGNYEFDFEVVAE